MSLKQLLYNKKNTILNLKWKNCYEIENYYLLNGSGIYKCATWKKYLNEKLNH